MECMKAFYTPRTLKCMLNCCCRRLHPHRPPNGVKCEKWQVVEEEERREEEEFIKLTQ